MDCFASLAMNDGDRLDCNKAVNYHSLTVVALFGGARIFCILF